MAAERTLSPRITDTDFFKDADHHDDLRHRLLRLTPLNPNSVYTKLNPEMIRKHNQFVIKDAGSQDFRAYFDMSAFKPEEIEVRIDGPVVTVAAKHEDNDTSLWTEYALELSLQGSGIDPRTLSIELSRDGVLTLIGPAVNAASEVSPETKERETTHD